MKKLLLALAILFVPTIAFAQCNGVFPNNTVCGNITGANNTPRATNPSAFLGAAGGTSGQIQYNNGGALGGYTQSGDCTTNTATGVITCTKLQGVPVTTTSASTNDILTYNGSSWLHSPLITLFNSICAASPTSCGGLFGFLNVKWYGATGDCNTDDTAAFQSAWNAATGTSGYSRIWIPATTSCYLVSKINGTNSVSVIVNGAGDQSVIKVSGADANSNWWDLSGSNNIQFNNIKVINDASHIPAILFLWACTGTNCNASGVLAGLSLSHVNINAKTTSAFLYGYGFGCIAGAACQSGGSLNISDATWTETNNGPGGMYPTAHQNAPIVLDAQNSRNVRSVYVTVTTTAAATWRAVIKNVDFIDYSNGSTLSNNAAGVFYNTPQLTVIGGSFQCVCNADVVIWSNSEGETFIQTAFIAPDGSAGETNYWVAMGGGLNGYLTWITPFWSSPAAGFILIDTATSATVGGVNNMRIIGSDIGANFSSAPFLATNGGGICAPWTPSLNWLVNVQIDFIAGANSISTCGSIDSVSILQNVGSINLASGATDHGTSNPFRH